MWILVRGLEARWRELPKQVALDAWLESVQRRPETIEQNTALATTSRTRGPPKRSREDGGKTREGLKIT